MPSSRYSNRFGSTGYNNNRSKSQSKTTEPVETADQIQARITREQYDDYKARFTPWLQELNSKVSSDQLQSDKTQWGFDIRDSTNQAYRNGLVASNLNTSRFGVNESARAKASNSTLGLLDAASNRVARTNAMNQNIDDRRMALLSGKSTKGGM